MTQEVGDTERIAGTPTTAVCDQEFANFPASELRRLEESLFAHDGSAVVAESGHGVWVMIRRLVVALATMAATAMMLTGCGLVVPGGAGTKSVSAAQKTEMTSDGPVVDAVRAAFPEFLQVEVGANQDGLATGVMVDAEVPLGYVITGEKLKSVLVSVWNSADPKPAFVKFNPWSAYEGKKGAIKAQRAAEELGIDWSPSFSVGVNVPDYEIKKLAGD